MRLVLLSGGSGKRLWPLSNDTRSKQFLKLLKSDDDSLESMAQRVWRQLKKSNLDQNTVISTSQAQLEMIRSQLGDVPVITEQLERYISCYCFSKCLPILDSAN
ncbi:mannose-6-phosphate isomerase [Gracilibacillus halophilus YIM-C55.5]|uniref:Mannose-6-phosphate isomerase n=1 Tax=Gracilibacillus halophilus YIM-C55.5 TaxID=1308866 RepID=N4WPS8_9BACI|nr:mannose-6-phosphate isomerase [Gracilibacillus halophilus YIM-C55.5]